MNVSFNLPAAKYDGNSWYGCINLYFVGFKWSGWSYNWRRIILTGLNKLFTLRPSAPVLFHLLNWILNIAGFLCAEYQMSILSNYWYNHADVRSAFLLAVNKHVFNCVWEFSITWPTAQQKQQLCLEIDFFFLFLLRIIWLCITRLVTNVEGLNELSESSCHSIIQIQWFIRVRYSIRES